MAGLLDMLNDPQSAGLLQFGLGLLQNSGPSRVPQSFGQVLGNSSGPALQTYKGLADRQAVTKALNSGDMQGAYSAMLQSTDPELQKMAMASKLQAFQPDYQLKQALLQQLIGGAQGQPGGMTQPASPDQPQAPTAIGNLTPSARTALALTMPNEANALAAQDKAAREANPYIYEKAKQAGGLAAKQKQNANEVAARSQSAMSILDKLDALNADAASPSGDSAWLQMKIGRNLPAGKSIMGVDGQTASNYSQIEQQANALKLLDIKPLLQGTGQVRKGELDMINKLENITPEMNRQERADLIKNVRGILKNSVSGANYQAGAMTNPLDPNAQAPELTTTPLPGTQAPALGPQDIGNAVMQAKSAIARGAPRDAVLRRLQQYGIDPAQAGF